MQRPVVDLPQPDSPTSPRVSPSLDVEGDVVHGLAPILPKREKITPWLTGKCFFEALDLEAGRPSTRLPRTAPRSVTRFSNWQTKSMSPAKWHAEIVARLDLRRAAAALAAALGLARRRSAG